jgi:hypothetical protein
MVVVDNIIYNTLDDSMSTLHYITLQSGILSTSWPNLSLHTTLLYCTLKPGLVKVDLALLAAELLERL